MKTKTKPAKPSPREDLLARLLRATKRLVKLLGLDAPTAILQNEAELIYNRARMLDPESAARAEGRHWREANAHKHGFCAVEGCEEPPIGDYNDPATRPGPGATCAKHTADDDDDDDEMDLTPSPEETAAMERLAVKVEEHHRASHPWIGKPLMITIEGPAGAGKTWLAGQIAELMCDEGRPVAVVDSGLVPMHTPEALVVIRTRKG